MKKDWEIVKKSDGTYLQWGDGKGMDITLIRSYIVDAKEDEQDDTEEGLSIITKQRRIPDDPKSLRYRIFIPTSAPDALHEDLQQALSEAADAGATKIISQLRMMLAGTLERERERDER